MKLCVSTKTLNFNREKCEFHCYPLQNSVFPNSNTLDVQYSERNEIQIDV